MSRLDELIQELCPDGVEYKEIKDIANVSIGEFVHKSKQNPNAEYPVFNGGITNTGFYDEFNRTANKIIISARGANAGFVNRVFSNFWSGNSCYTIDVTDCTIDWNFLFYWLKSKEQKLLGDQQKGGIPAVSKKQVERFTTPVPPLEVQREIVRILDNFTELTAELTARKKQYEYYRDTLLGRKTVETEEVFLEDIATYSKERIPANEVDEYSYVGVDNLLQEKRGKTVSSHVPTDGNLTKYYPGDILIGNIRPYLRKIWFADNIGGTNGDVLVIHVTSDKVLPQYLYCNLSSERFLSTTLQNPKVQKCHVVIKMR